jgi:hypothetical protein
MQSADGDVWSNALPIYLTSDENILPVAPKLYPNDSGQIHAVWSSFNKDGSGGPGYYAQLDIADSRWHDIVELDTPGIRTPNVIEYHGDIIVTYYHNNENKNWWRKSSDEGQTWSNPALISPLHKGTNGFTSFVIDSNDNLHLFFGQRIDDNNHGIWHTLWIGNGWTEILPVVRGPQVRDEEGGRGFDPHSARATIVNGNHLLVTWVTDGFAGLNGAWYASAIINTPELPRLPLATPTPISVNSDVTVDLANELATPTPTPYILSNQQLSMDGTINSPTIPLLTSIIPVIALIISIVVFRLIWQDR